MKYLIVKDQALYDALMRFSTASYEKYGNYSHTAGVYEYLISAIMADLPKKQRTYYLEMIEKMAQGIVQEQTTQA